MKKRSGTPLIREFTFPKLPSLMLFAGERILGFTHTMEIL